MNRIYTVVKNGELADRTLPLDILRKFDYAGIENPYICKSFENYRENGW